MIRSLDKLCGHQATADLLAQCNTNDCMEIARNLHKLNRLTGTLKSILTQGQSIINFIPICEEVNRSISGDTNTAKSSQNEQSVPEVIPGITSLTLYLSNSILWNRAELDQELKDMQAQIFDELGVIIPQVTILENNAIDPHDFQLQLNDQKLPVTAGLALDELWVFVPFERVKDRFPDGRVSVEPNFGGSAAILKATEAVRQEIITQNYDSRSPLGFIIFYIAAELRHRADELLTLDVVEYYLSKLKIDFQTAGYKPSPLGGKVFSILPFIKGNRLS